MKNLVWMLLLCLALSLTASAQITDHLAFNGGWLHLTGNQGPNGFNVGAEYFVVPKVSVAFDYDNGWVSQTIGVFQLTSVGLTTIHNNQQNWMIGPRVYLPSLFKSHLKTRFGRIVPLAELQFGESNLFSQVTSVNGMTARAADTAFTWSLGGGADIRINPHWSGRAKVDLLRTHFASSGQSHLRLVLGVAYFFKARE